MCKNIYFSVGFDNSKLPTVISETNASKLANLNNRIPHHKKMGEPAVHAVDVVSPTSAEKKKSSDITVHRRVL